jgi:predicted dehydrogenase
VHDRNSERAAQVAAETLAPALDWAGLLAVSDAVVVAVPAAFHTELAEAALQAGKHVLVEKPIATTLADADRLATLADRRGLILQVGHLERFSAAHGAILARAGEPLFMEANRVGTFKTRGTDVSVVLDLMIHDIDLVLALTDALPETVDAIGAPVASPRIDIASARLGFASGAVATLTASRVASRVDRRMRIFGPQGVVAVDFAGRRLSMTARGQGEKLPSLPGFGLEVAQWEERDALQAEQEAFVAAVLDGAPVIVDALAGRRALDVALRVEAAIERTQERLRASGLLNQTENGFGGGF